MIQSASTSVAPFTPHASVRKDGDGWAVYSYRRPWESYPTYEQARAVADAINEQLGIQPATSVGTGATCHCPLALSEHVYSLACHERTLARSDELESVR